MKIEKVTYQKTYSIGPYLTDRIGLEASVDEGESAADVLDNLRGKADEWHKSEHPHLYQDDYGISNPPTGPVSYTKESIIPPIIDKSIERLEIAIDNCRDLEELDKLKADNPLFPARLLESFNKKRKELSNA